MPRIFALTRTTIAALAVAATAAIPVHVADAGEAKAGAIEIHQPWTRATPKGAKVAGGFMVIKNSGGESDRLIGGTFEKSGRVEIHEMKMEGDVMKMRELEGGLEIEPGQSVTLKPGSYHVMFMELSEPLEKGQSIAGTLSFAKAGDIAVTYKVEAMGKKSAMKHGGHGGHGKQ